jgi:hypothetical protein
VLGAGRVHPDRPALVYLLRQSPSQAATGSLLVMGIGAVTVAITHTRAGRARLRTGAVFRSLTPLAGLGTGRRFHRGGSEQRITCGQGLDGDGKASRKPFIAAPPGTSSRRLLDEALTGAGLSPRIAVVTAQREAILPLVLAGAGAALLPEPLTQVAARLGAVVSDPHPPITRSIVLAHRPGPLAPAARRFLELATTPRAPAPGSQQARPWADGLARDAAHLGPRGADLATDNG